MTMAPQDPQTSALLAHVFQQTQSNISFLASQNYISPAEASDFISRLTTAQTRANSPTNRSADSFQAGMQNLTIAPVAAPVSPNNTGRRIPPPPPARLQRAKALWAYNEEGREPNDLSFSAGEIVEIVDETNADWWTGKCRGRQGLFPSNHVEKIDSPMPGAPAPPPPMQPMPPMAPPVQAMYSPPPGPGGYAPNYMDDKQGYRSYGSPYPPPGPGAMQVAPAPPPQPVVVQEAPPKKNRFGGLGNTMANAAAGGVGFGAGAAIGGGIIDAIF